MDTNSPILCRRQQMLGARRASAHRHLNASLGAVLNLQCCQWRRRVTAPASVTMGPLKRTPNRLCAGGIDE